MYTNKTLIVNHLKTYMTIYIFMLILFLTGVIFGAIIVNSMNFIQKQDLFFYLEQFFERIEEDQSVSKLEILKSSYFYHVKYLLLLFILGLSVIGLPIIWILLFLKGIVIGFSVGFIVNQLGLKGLLLASASIAPQNIIIIPVYILAGSLSMIFSLILLGKLFTRKSSQPISEPLKQYVLIFIILLFVSFIAAIVEAFLANGAMESLIRLLY